MISSWQNEMTESLCNQLTDKQRRQTIESNAAWWKLELISLTKLEKCGYGRPTKNGHEGKTMATPTTAQIRGKTPPISEIINCVLLGVEVRLPHWIGLVVFCDIVANVLEFHSQSQVPPKVRLAVQEVGAQRSVGAGRWVCRKKNWENQKNPMVDICWHMLTYVDIIFWKWQHGYKLGSQMRPLMINHGNLAGRDDLDTTQRS